MDGERISLAIDNIAYIKIDSTELEPNTDETLWFNISKPTGSYVFEIKTVDGKLYRPVLNWVQP